jgi:transposase
LKSGVTKACWYDPELNPGYRDLAEHFGMAVLPARPYHPRDKAAVVAAASGLVLPIDEVKFSAPSFSRSVATWHLPVRG